MDAGRFLEAEAIFANLLEKHPGQAALTSLYAGARAAHAQWQERATRLFANARPTPVPAPPFAYRMFGRAPTDDDGRPPPQLKVISETRNQITDDEAWFVKNDLALPTLTGLGPAGGIVGVKVGVGITDDSQELGVAVGVAVAARPLYQAGLPTNLPAAFGTSGMTLAIDDGVHYVVAYGPYATQGRYLAVIDRKRHAVDGLLDLASFLEPPKALVQPGENDFVHGGIAWAVVEDGVAFVSTGHLTYAHASGGRNAFVSAIDLATGKLLWQSAPLVSNARNFIVRGNHIITGYGFTKEHDYVYVLDRATGRTLSRLQLKKSPSYLIEKNGALYVRTYSYDYVLKLD
jgi:hypothetical protein